MGFSNVFFVLWLPGGVGKEGWGRVGEGLGRAWGGLGFLYFESPV